jgi:CelD/BcsL family acetyltransferase involved in cellulose biosynthesis
MILELHRDPSVFTRLAGEWNDLLGRSICRVPFLRAEFQRAWWQHLGGGEWPASAQLLVMTAREAEGAPLAGIAPLFHGTDRDGRPGWLFVGSQEIADYLDFIAPRQNVEALISAVFDHLAQPDLPAWEVLDFYNLPESSPTRAALARAAAARGWAAGETRLMPAPVIPLPASWDEYLARLDSKDRHELRRKIRRAEGAGATIRWVTCGDTCLEEEVNAFLNMMAHDPEKERFLTPAMRQQFVDVAHAAQQGGWLHLSILETRQGRAAVHFSFDLGGRLWLYNSAVDPQQSGLSAGWVLVGRLIQWAIETGHATVDFMRGDEGYKYRFGAADTRLYRTQISRTLPVEALGASPASPENPLEADFFPPQ